MTSEQILEGAFDLHVHASPDVIPRAMDLGQLSREVDKAGMAGMLIKDHCTSTVGRVAALNQLGTGRCRFFSSLVLNPTVGGLNPTAVEAALRVGADVIYFPTYGAANHIKKWGAGKPPTAFPLSEKDLEGIAIVDENNKLLPEAVEIIKLIADYQAVLATGHISAHESLILLKQARSMGVRRLLVTHASESVSQFSVAQQQEAIRLGALVEHSFFAATPFCPNPITLDYMGNMIRATGVTNVILSSDFGQPSNGNPVKNFGRHLEQMQSFGFSLDDIRQMVCTNPQKLFRDRATCC